MSFPAVKLNRRSLRGIAGDISVEKTQLSRKFGWRKEFPKGLLLDLF
jgi:hypothetical protein